jgi:hypothetical protein
MINSSFVQQAADTVKTVTGADDVSYLNDITPLLVDRQIQMILWRQTLELYGNPPFLLPSAPYNIMMQQPEIPYRNNAEQFRESMRKSLQEYYKAYYEGQIIGTSLAYFSFLLIFL